ncbi:MAG: carbamoyl-phosphate synthase large subunit, partial [Firmicutes bacterium]|nr:carbamoyl-phosphate synthase large subunit [Bacillota bacterium]
RKEGYEVIMVNCNPETVSTDYDISDRLYFEPLTLEDVLNIYETEQPAGVILQFGGQTPLKLALPLMERGVRIWGTSPIDIDRAENRREFAAVVEKLGLVEPPYGTATTPDEALEEAAKLGFPVLVRPSYVLGGRSMQVVYNRDTLISYLQDTEVLSAQNPLLLDKFLEGAVEIDVDAVSDGTDTFIGGIMEHVEYAGIHSGDSSCVIPTFSLRQEQLQEIRRQTLLLARSLNVIGLCNIQYAIRGDRIYLIEANPRASRTVPFVDKATGIPLARVAAKVMAGRKLEEMGLTAEVKPKHFAVKEAVLPFSRFPEVDIILGPEMRSTGEVMGIDPDFGLAFAKSQLAAGTPLPLEGKVFVTVANRDKGEAIALSREFSKLGFGIIATAGTAAALRTEEIEVEEVKRLQEGKPNILQYIERGEVGLIINTPSGTGSQTDEARMRQKALARGVSIITTMRAAGAALEGIKMLRKKGMEVLSLQEYQRTI